MYVRRAAGAAAAPAASLTVTVAPKATSSRGWASGSTSMRRGQARLDVDEVAVYVEQLVPGGRVVALGEQLGPAAGQPAELGLQLLQPVGVTWLGDSLMRRAGSGSSGAPSDSLTNALLMRATVADRTTGRARR